MNIVMKKSFPKHFLTGESFFLFLIFYTVIYGIEDVDIQIPGYKVSTTGKQNFAPILIRSTLEEIIFPKISI